MIYKLKSILLFIAILIGIIVNGQKHYHFKASHFDYSSKDTLVKFNFDIKHFKDNDVFNVKLSAVDKNQKSYNVNSLFEHKDLKGGKNTIFWNPLLDGYKLDGDYQINLELRKSSEIKIPYSKHIVKSLLFPGWGDMKLRNANKFFLFGIGTIAYGSLFYSLDYNSRANKNYNAYINSYNVEESDNFFLNAKKDANISRILAGITAITWSADIIFLAKRIKKVKNDGTVSDFYNKMQNKVHSTKYKNYKYLNTKPKEEKYLDSAIVEYKNRNFNRSENLLKTAQAYPSKDTLVLQKIEKYASIVKDELNFIAYNKLGNEKLKKLQLIDAKKEFLKAQKIKPNSREVVNKIDSINNYYAYLKKGNKYYKTKDYDNAQLSYENANKIYKTDSSKFKVLMSKADNYYIQKFYLRSEIEYKKAIKIFPNISSLNQRLVKVQKIIKKINNDNTQYASLISEAKNFIEKEDYNNALLKYQQAIKFKSKESLAKEAIKKINNYLELVKKGDQAKSKNNFKISLDYYTQAKLIFVNSNIRRKIRDVESEMEWDNIIDAAKRLKVKAENLESNNVFDEALVKYKESLEKCKQAKIIKTTNNLNYLIAKIDSKIKELNKKLNKGKVIISRKWISIYKTQKLEVKIRFHVHTSGCQNSGKSTSFEVKYEGLLESSEKYVNFKVDYQSCRNGEYTFEINIPLYKYGKIEGRNLSSIVTNEPEGEIARWRSLWKFTNQNSDLSIYNIRELNQFKTPSNSPKN